MRKEDFTLVAIVLVIVSCFASVWYVAHRKSPLEKETETIQDGHYHVVKMYMIQDSEGNYYSNEFGKPYWPLERHAQVECNWLNRQWKEKHEN